jgi:hypothetical protein
MIYFQKYFSTIEDLRKFLLTIRSDKEFFELVGNSTLLAQDDSIITSRELESLRSLKGAKYGDFLDESSIYETVLHNQYSVRVKDLMYNGLINSIPISDFKAVWNSLTWLINHDNEKIFQKLKPKLLSKDQALIFALQQEDLKWLGKVPIDKLKALRERGELEDLRNLLSRNVRSIQNASDEEFSEIGSEVKNNIEQAMLKHKSEIKDLNEKYRTKYKIGVASMVTTGTIGIASALYPPLAQTIGILAAVIGSGSVIQNIDNFIDKRHEVRELQKKPVAMLVEAKDSESNNY